MADSTVMNVEHQSMSTDSEESFLIKQLNKSNHFNSSSSNSGQLTDSSGSMSGSRNSYNDESHSLVRRSSFLLNTSNDDSTGPQRSFTVLRDTIDEEMNESHEEILNLSGLSVLNAEVLHEHQALGVINPNVSTVSAEKLKKILSRNSLILKDINISSNTSSSNSLSLKYEKGFRNQINKESSQDYLGTSPKSSLPSSEKLPNQKDSSNSQPAKDDPVSKDISSKNVNSYQDIVEIKTPDFPAPEPPLRDSIDELTLTTEPFSNDLATNKNEGTVQVSNHYKSYNISKERILVPPNMANVYRKQSNSSDSTSYKTALTNSDSSHDNAVSVKSNLSKASIINLNDTRKKNVGTPHLIFSKQETTSFTGVDFKGSFGETPKLELAKKAKESRQVKENDGSVREQPYNQNKLLLVTEKDIFKKPPLLNTREPDYADDDDDSNLELPDSSFSSNEYNDTFEHRYNDKLLEKIHYYRNQPVSKRATSNNKLAWILYLISFLIPPLFFFLGLGLLDEHLEENINPQIKKLSLITGSVVLLLAFAMIGVGFGVGIKLAQS